MSEEKLNLGNSEDKLSTILKVVSFIFPIVGAILYFVWKDSKPVSSKSACTFALYGFAFGIIMNILFAVLGGMGG